MIAAAKEIRLAVRSHAIYCARPAWHARWGHMRNKLRDYERSCEFLGHLVVALLQSWHRTYLFFQRVFAYKRQNWQTDWQTGW